MSYKQFVTDLNEFYKNNKNKETHYEVGQTVIRDKWIKDRRYDELIDFILENWDSGNCDDFIEPLEKKLVNESHIVGFEKLWRKIIYYRLHKFLETYYDYKKVFKKVDLASIEEIDSSNFNMFSVESYNDLKRVLAFRRQFLLKGIEKYKKGLLKLNDEKELLKLNDLVLGVRNLDITKIRKDNWC